MTRQITCLKGELTGPTSSDQITAQGRLRQARASRLAVKGHSGRDQLFPRISLVQYPWTTNDGRRSGEKETARVMYEEFTSALLLSVCVNFPNIYARQIKVSEWDCTVPSLQQLLLYVSSMRLDRPWYQRPHREEPCASCCMCKSFTGLLWHVSPTNTPQLPGVLHNSRGAEGILFLLQ